MVRSFEEIGEYNLVESLCDINGLVVDSILYSMLFNVSGLLGDFLPVFVGNFGRVDFQSEPCFEVDKLGWTVGIVEMQFVVVMEGMKEDYFMLAMAKMAHGIDKRVVVVGAYQGIGKDDYQRAPVEFFGKLMECGSDVGGALGGIVGRGKRGAQFFFEKLQQILLVGAAAATGGSEVDIVRNEREAEGIALANKKLAEHGGSIAGKSKLVGGIGMAVAFDGK